MTPASPLRPIPPSVWLLTALCVIVGVLGLAAAWTGVALLTRTQAGWMALIAALDAAVMLRLAGFPSSRLRAALAVGVILVAIALANFLLIATRMGMRLGLDPSESARLLSVEMAWVLAGYANAPLDLAWIVGATLAAWWLGR